MWDEEHDNGEWEIGTDNHFDEMVSAAGEVISNTDFADADEVLIDAMLFAVARDNECEMLADELLKHEGWFTLLAKSSLGSEYVNAQWQFAKRIGEIELLRSLGDIYSKVCQGSALSRQGRGTAACIADFYLVASYPVHDAFAILSLGDRGFGQFGICAEHKTHITFGDLPHFGLGRLLVFRIYGIFTDFILAARNGENGKDRR